MGRSWTAPKMAREAPITEAWLVRGHYPGLYFPMLEAWDWWRVAPVRLPTSIRYLDTFAHQGGAGDMLVAEYRVAARSGSKVYFEPVKPPNGYGIGDFSIEAKALPTNAQIRRSSMLLSCLDRTVNWVRSSEAARLYRRYWPTFLQVIYSAAIPCYRKRFLLAGYRSIACSSFLSVSQG